MAFDSENQDLMYETLVSSLWKCEVCETFVSIHSTKMVLQAKCPTCDAGQLRFCGTFDHIMGTAGAA